MWGGRERRDILRVLCAKKGVCCGANLCAGAGWAYQFFPRTGWMRKIDMTVDARSDFWLATHTSTSLPSENVQALPFLPPHPDH